MFDQKPTNQNQIGAVPPNLPADPEDILAGIEKEEDASVIRTPAQPAEKVEVPMPPAVPKAARTETKEPFFQAHKKAIVFVFLIIIGIVILAAAGWYGYNYFVLAKPAVQPGNSALNVGSQMPVNANQAAVNQNINQAPPAPVDTDRDGLNDEEEGMYGTNPNEVDTDLDGLTDRDEVKVFKTDPNNSDTDGDTYLDGEEIRGGYDPKGPGRLLEIE